MVVKTMPEMTGAPKRESGGALSLEESRARLQKLVEGRQGKEKAPELPEEEPARKERLPLPPEKEKDEEEEMQVAAEAPASVPSSSSDDQTSDDGVQLDEEEKEKAKKVGPGEALAWLYAWWERQKKKLIRGSQ